MKIVMRKSFITDGQFKKSIRYAELSKRNYFSSAEGNRTHQYETARHRESRYSTAGVGEWSIQNEAARPQGRAALYSWCESSFRTSSKATGCKRRGGTVLQSP